MSQKKIKILHIINNLEIGGAEKILVLLLKELSKRDDIELHLVSLEGHGPLIKDIPKNVFVKEFKYRIFLPRNANRLDQHFRFSLFNYIRNVKPDLIHGHLYKGEDFAKTMGFIFRVPVITTMHDTLIYPGVRARMLNFVTKKAVAVSKPVGEHLEKFYHLPKNKITIIPNTIDFSHFKGCHKAFNIKKPVFVYIGRLLDIKGVDDAIVGLARLKKDYPGLEFLIYGKAVFDDYQKKLDKLVKDNKWDFVKFMGRTEDVPSALKKADIFISPSKTEGFGISVLEAAAAGKPVIATKTGAIPDIVEDGESGFLVDWHQPDQIYWAGKKLLDKNLVTKFGKRGQEIAKGKYDIGRVADMYYELYREVLGEDKKT